MYRIFYKIKTFPIKKHTNSPPRYVYGFNDDDNDDNVSYSILFICYYLIKLNLRFRVFYMFFI